LELALGIRRIIINCYKIAVNNVEKIMQLNNAVNLIKLGTEYLRKVQVNNLFPKGWFWAYGELKKKVK